MKNSAEYAKKLTKLCTSLKKNSKDAPDLVDKTIAREPANILLLGCISEYASVHKSHIALTKLRSGFVDFNELRVSRPREISKILGKNYPNSTVVIERMIRLLNSVFRKYDGLDMAGIDDMGKREAQAMIKELDGMTPYIYSFFIMYYIEAHAFPLNDNMYDVLKAEGVVNTASDFDDVHGFLERQIAAVKARETFIMLRDYCDSKAKEIPAPVEEAVVTKKKVAKKTAKKAVAPKAAEAEVEAEIAVKKTAKKKTVKKTVKKAKKKTTK